MDELKYFDIIPELESIGIAMVDAAAKRELTLQLHAPPAGILLPPAFKELRQAIWLLLANLIHLADKKSIIRIHAMPSDTGCMVEVINKSVNIGTEKLQEYFKDTRRIVETDLKGEFLFQRTAACGNYFRIKVGG